ncbi:MAG: hypothetical protein AAGI22_14785 [Planctomycetota bacterium]
MPAPQNPVIVIPGITATCLRDDYELDAKRVWTALRTRYDDVALHPDDTRYERQLPARVIADQVFDIPYDEMLKDLRHDLSPHRRSPTPVYAFPYDWRQPLVDTEAQLADFIEEVIDRTSLMRHYHAAGYANDPKVDLVGHSMGGLVIAGYLGSHGGDGRVGKVATLGSPFRGSFEAVIKVTTGLSSIGGKSASREREVSRIIPALYHLMPKFRGALETDPGIPTSIFDPDAWQKGVTATIEEYFRDFGKDARMRSGDRKAAAAALFKDMLDGARKHRNRMERLDLESAGMTSRDWLCVVGVGDETRVKLKIERSGRDVRFDLSSVERRQEWNPKKYAPTDETGDGTVPYNGARCSFVPRDEVVCVSGHDWGYWEIGDRLLDGPIGVGLHGMLPKMNVVQKLIVSHFKGRGHSGVWGRRAPDMPLNERWNPPIRGLREKKPKA